jgi:hypothetical protein
MEAFNGISRNVITFPYARAQPTSVKAQFKITSRKYMGDEVISSTHS